MNRLLTASSLHWLHDSSAIPLPPLSNDTAHWLVLDLADDQILRENLPPLRAREQRALLRQRLSSRFPHTAFRQALPSPAPGHTLLYALQPSTALQHWLEKQKHAPIAAVFSACQVWGALALALHNTACILCVSDEQGLRQSLYDAGTPLLTRYLRLPSLTDRHAWLQEECQRFVRYAASQFPEHPQVPAYLLSASDELIPVAPETAPHTIQPLSLTNAWQALTAEHAASSFESLQLAALQRTPLSWQLAPPALRQTFLYQQRRHQLTRWLGRVNRACWLSIPLVLGAGLYWQQLANQPAPAAPEPLPASESPEPRYPAAQLAELRGHPLTPDRLMAALHSLSALLYPAGQATGALRLERLHWRQGDTTPPDQPSSLTLQADIVISGEQASRVYDSTTPGTPRNVFPGVPDPWPEVIPALRQHLDTLFPAQQHWRWQLSELSAPTHSTTTPAPSRRWRIELHDLSAETTTP